MVYKRNIPVVEQDMADSVADLNENFTQLASVFDANHYTFDDSSAANRGNHRQVTYVEQSSAEVDAIEPPIDSIAMYCKDSSGNPELFAKVNDGTLTQEFQVTKNAEMFMGLRPFAAVNFDVSGAIQGSDLGVASVTRNPAGRGNDVYRITFDSAQTDNDYFWSIHGFSSGSNPTVSQPYQTASYGDSVKTTSIDVQFKNQNGAGKTIVRAMVICWRFQ
jgi:hypothetical protein